MVRLGHVAGGMQGIADGLQRRRGAELLEPVGGEVIDRLEGGGLEVAVVLLPVRAGALAVVRLGGVEVLALQLAVVEIDHGVPVDVGDAAVDLVVAVVVAAVGVAMGVAVPGQVEEVPVRGVVDDARSRAPQRRVFVADPPAPETGVLEVVHVEGRLAEDLPGLRLAAGGAHVEPVGLTHLLGGVGGVHEGQGVLDDVLVGRLRPGVGLAGDGADAETGGQAGEGFHRQRSRVSEA